VLFPNDNNGITFVPVGIVEYKSVDLNYIVLLPVEPRTIAFQILCSSK
jgi:hypothetical protein